MIELNDNWFLLQIAFICKIICYFINIMRTFRLGIAGGKVLSRACFSLLVISNIYFSSCEDDLDRGRISANIFFTPEIRAYWDLLIRSMASTEVPQDSVASLQGGYPLFLSLHLIYRSITVPSIVREEEATGRKTRVTSVTTNNIHDYFRVLAYAYTSRWSENQP